MAKIDKSSHYATDARTVILGRGKESDSVLQQLFTKWLEEKKREQLKSE